MMRGQETKNDALSSSGEASFADLRESIASIADDLKQVVETRGLAAKEQAEQGVHSLREAIRRQPALAMGIALLIGAAVALIGVPRGGQRSQFRSSWLPSIPSVSRADLYDLADAIQRKTVHAVNSVPLASSLERVADALSKVEPSALSSAFEKIGSWFQQMRTANKH